MQGVWHRSTSPGKSLQDIINAFTRPTKWMVEQTTTIAAASVSTSGTSPTNSSSQNATSWPLQQIMTKRILDETNEPITAELTSVQDDLVFETTSITTTVPNVIFTGEDFWYRYGISITVAILVFVVAVVLFIQCRMFFHKRIRRRRLVDFSRSDRSRPDNKARNDVFESYHRQTTASFTRQPSGAAVSSSNAMHEEIPLEILRDPSMPAAQSALNRGRSVPSMSARYRADEPLARVYPLRSADPRGDVNANNLTDPLPCDTSRHRRLWDTTAGPHVTRSHRTVLSEPSAIARPTSRHHAARARPRRMPMRGEPPAYGLPKFNLWGNRIVTSPDSNDTHRTRDRQIRHNRMDRTQVDAHHTMLAELNVYTTPKLIVPTNTPNTNCTDSPADNSPPRLLPDMDSDFGASAGVPHFLVSPGGENSPNVTGDVRDVTFEWDSYDPAYLNRTVSYVEGAYFPVLHRRQYWV